MHVRSGAKLLDFGIARFTPVADSGPGDTATLVRYSLFVNLLGRAEEARGKARLARELNPLAALPFECLSVVLYTAREFEACVACADEGLELNPHSGLLHLYRGLSLAEIYAASDRPHEALDALAKAFERSQLKLLSIGLDPAFDRLRDRPRFKRLLIGTGLAAYLDRPARDA